MWSSSSILSCRVGAGVTVRVRGSGYGVRGEDDGVRVVLDPILGHLLVDAAHREAELVAVDAAAAVGIEEGEDGLVLGDALVAHTVLALQLGELRALARVRGRG